MRTTLAKNCSTDGERHLFIERPFFVACSSDFAERWQRVVKVKFTNKERTSSGMLRAFAIHTSYEVTFNIHFLRRGSDFNDA
jgi:hypothetical protein